MPGGDSAADPPDPMPNSEVKRRSADGSVGSPHVRVGNRQALIEARERRTGRTTDESAAKFRAAVKRRPPALAGGFCFCGPVKTPAMKSTAYVL